jgi:hypothetical protein
MAVGDNKLKRVRLKFERDFTQIPNEWLRNGKLSLGARGLLGLLMSHNDGFVVTYKSLAASNPEGITAITGFIQELKQGNYLEISKERDGRGRIAGWLWIICDPEEKKSRSTPDMGLPDMATPDMGTPDMGNQYLKEANVKEHLNQVNETSSSTRAGNEDVDALSGDDHWPTSSFINTRCVAGHLLIEGTNYCSIACKKHSDYVASLSNEVNA